ncbi:HepT-like ribonuclease domain-containing protein [Candidatus Pyrohabitans sp.]
MIDAELAESLKKLSGLRNILVHRYNRVEESIVVDGLEDIRAGLERFVEVVEDALKRIFGEDKTGASPA